MLRPIYAEMLQTRLRAPGVARPTPMQTWDPDWYARHARFVSDLGEPVLDLLAPQPGERVLDLGCGDGALTEKLVRDRLEPRLRTPEGGLGRRLRPPPDGRHPARGADRMNRSGAASQPPAPLTPPSRWVWGFGNLAVRVFYRVQRLGHTLPDGALLLVANHPNTLIDPAVIQATAGRRIRFLGKSTLFANHPLSPLIRRSGAIPVYRKMDSGVDTSRNVEMFAAVNAALAAGEAICLFPEGLSHSSGRLEPLPNGSRPDGARQRRWRPTGHHRAGRTQFRSRRQVPVARHRGLRPAAGLRGSRGALRHR